MQAARLLGLAVAGAVCQLIQCGFAITTQAQPATLTLTCKGTTTSGAESKAEPVSMGVIVNFTTRTIQGFGYPGLLDYPVMITAANDVTVAFSGQQKLGSSLSSIMGTIDRVTGDLEATSALDDEKQSKRLSETSYALQCRPTQRLF